MATFLGLLGVVRINYPDMPAVKRGYEGGLDRELGGKDTVIVSETSLYGQTHVRAKANVGEDRGWG